MGAPRYHVELHTGGGYFATAPDGWTALEMSEHVIRAAISQRDKTADVEIVDLRPDHERPPVQ